MPPALKNQPALGSHLIPYLDAYNSLTCHRTRTESGYNPLLFSDLVLHAQTHGFFRTPEEFQEFKVLIQACDHAFLGFADERHRQAMAKMKSKSG